MAVQTGGAVRLATEKPFNNLLRTLREQDYALIAPHLVEADQEANELLYNPGDNVDEPINGYHFIGADINWASEVRTHQP